MGLSDSKFVFAAPKKHEEVNGDTWNVLVVDDEESAHDITTLALHNFEFKGKGLNFVSAYSAKEAIEILEKNQDFALIFLDVVMETQDAGLLVVQYVRDVLQNNRIRIVIRTGQPGEAPEREIIDLYDINDYKEKTELSVDKLYTTIRTALSQYKQIKELYDGEVELRLLNNNLEKRIDKALEKQQIQQARLFEQSRSAHMSELLNMLAHQWRQPLSSIGAVVAKMKLNIAFDECNLSVFEEGLDGIDSYIQGLSDTITAFRDLHKPSKQKDKKSVINLIEQSASLIATISDSLGIEMHIEYSECTQEALFSNELVQVLLHILKNSQDELYAKNIQSPYIDIKAWDNEIESFISITDNAGGIPESIKAKIFDPYFSTKDEKNGTGLGLYHSQVIIREKFKGEILVDNTPQGVCFTVRLPN